MLNKTLPVPARDLGFFLAAALLQTVLLLVGPALQQYVLITGSEVTLKTAPVDPFDPMRGYFVTLSYDISRPDFLPGHPRIKEGEALYVLLKKPTVPGAAWTPVRSSTVPLKAEPGQTVIRGQVRSGQLVYGLETYYIPEAERTEIDRQLRSRPGALVDVKIDSSGQAAPVRLRIAGKVYEF